MAASTGEADLKGASPTLAECYAVAAALTVAASLVAGRPQMPAAVRRGGLGGLVMVLGVRGLLLTGQTRLVVPMATGSTFTKLDRRLYGPLCLVLAGFSSRSLLRRRQV